jgi:hypothetical protein
MKLDLLQEYIRNFAHLIATKKDDRHVFKYEMLGHFNRVWTSDTGDFASMYEMALSSDVTRRWWKRESYTPKAMMILLMRTEDQLARHAFRDLFDESKTVANRIDRFVFYCDELLRLYKRSHPLSIENHHYQDAAMISLYLSGMYPDRYTLYPGRVPFNHALEALGAPGTGMKDDLTRFFKLTSLVFKYLTKDQTITSLIHNGLRPENHLLLVHEFWVFAGGVWEALSPD